MKLTFIFTDIARRIPTYYRECFKAKVYKVHKVHILFIHLTVEIQGIYMLYGYSNGHNTFVKKRKKSLK